MLNKLNILNQKIVNNELWDSDYLKQIDIDELLDKREEAEFDSEWIRVYELAKNNKLTKETELIVNEIRENAFRRIYCITNSSDLAAYVSDDFELLCKLYIMKVRDEWLSKFVNVYLQKRIPCGQLEEVSDDFNKLFNKLID